MKQRTLFSAVVIAVGGLLLSGCASADPLNEDASSESDTIVIGSQDYYSNEIIAEAYAQALEQEGFTVDRQFRIGQREVYLPEIEAGKIDLFPEYSGNLLQYWQADTDARLPDEVYAELEAATPEGLQVLEQADATDQDSYTVTREYADKWKLSTIGDLKNVTETVTLGGNSELESRPYGPTGLKDTYGVDVKFTPVEDSGGPLTVKALTDNDIQVANIYTSDPAIKANDLVTLEDPEGLFLASHVVPIANSDLDPKAVEVINRVTAKLSPEALIAMNARSVDEQISAEQIAKDWLAEVNP